MSETDDIKRVFDIFLCSDDNHLSSFFREGIVPVSYIPNSCGVHIINSRHLQEEDKWINIICQKFHNGSIVLWDARLVKLSRELYGKNWFHSIYKLIGEI